MQYVSVAHQKAIAPRYRLATIIVAGFALTVLLFMLVARFVTPNGFVPGSEQWQKMIYAGVMILGLWLVVVRRLLMSQAVMNRAAANGVSGVLQRLITVTIVISTAAELVAILGFVFYMLTGEYQYSLRLGGVGLLLLAYAFPRRGEWERIVTASAEAQKRAM